MTVVVAFLCSNGAVIASDSLITTTLDDDIVGEHTIKKTCALPGCRIMGWAGPLDLGLRFQAVATNHTCGTPETPLDHAISISRAAIGNFQLTGLKFPTELTTVVAFEHGDEGQCCVFGNEMQPLLLNQDFFCIALGSGKIAADPFLRFLIDTFCRGKRPTVRDGRFLATWAVSYTIASSPGVGDPIRIATLERQDGTFVAKELTDNEIQEHKQAIEEASKSLRAWHDGLQAPFTERKTPPDLPIPPPPVAPNAAI